MGGVPLPDKLTEAQVESCLSFSRRVFGDQIFTTEPAHRGQHDRFLCAACAEVLNQSVKQLPTRQPWELKEAA
jgi:hypothetical protein